MKTNNPKIIGFIMLIVGIGVFYFWGSTFYKTISYPIVGSVAEAKVIGFKVSTNGARMVKSNNSISGRSPYFEFKSASNSSVKSYSKTPQFFMISNYKMGERIKVAYPTGQPQKAIIISWKELPGLLLMNGLAVLMLVVGKSYLFKK